MPKLLTFLYTKTRDGGASVWQFTSTSLWQGRLVNVYDSVAVKAEGKGNGVKVFVDVANGKLYGYALTREEGAEEKVWVFKRFGEAFGDDEFLLPEVGGCTEYVVKP